MRQRVEDFKENGLWVKHRGTYPHCIQTKASVLWGSMNSRCKVGGSLQKDEPAYIGCTMSKNFKNFQYFAEWCQYQVGYGLEGYQLDKDILVKLNKEYNESVCVFVPQEINLVLVRSNNTRGIYPVGVCFDKDRNLYAAKMRAYNKVQNLGRFTAIEDAFSVYKHYKEQYIKELANKWKEQIDPRVYEALTNYQVEITD